MDDELLATSGAERAFGRTLALSDGVFAIALTLLVLNLGVPPGTPAAGVGDALARMTPELGAYALSFAVISLFWLSHHRLFRVLARIDGRLMVLNLLQLGLVALVPFPTELLGVYGDSPAAAAAYATVVGLAGLGGTVTSLHVWRAGLADPRVDRSVLVHGTWRGAAVAGVFLASVPLALVSASAAEWSWLSIVVVRAVLRRVYRRPPSGPSGAVV